MESKSEAISHREWRYIRLPNLVAAGLAIVFAVIVFVMIRQAVAAANESACTGRIAYLAYHILYHQEATSELPASSNGNPPHSWRVLLLKDLGYESLHAQYHFDEPWDSEANLKVLAQMPKQFTCPNCPNENCTSYFLKLDGKGGFTVFERNGASIPWTKPQDIDPSTPTGTPCDSGGFAVATPTGDKEERMKVSRQSN